MVYFFFSILFKKLTFAHIRLSFGRRTSTVRPVVSKSASNVFGGMLTLKICSIWIVCLPHKANHRPRWRASFSPFAAWFVHLEKRPKIWIKLFIKWFPHTPSIAQEMWTNVRSLSAKALKSSETRRFNCVAISWYFGSAKMLSITSLSFKEISLNFNDVKNRKKSAEFLEFGRKNQTSLEIFVEQQASADSIFYINKINNQ